MDRKSLRKNGQQKSLRGGWWTVAADTGCVVQSRGVKEARSAWVGHILTVELKEFELD